MKTCSATLIPCLFLTATEPGNIVFELQNQNGVKIDPSAKTDGTHSSKVESGMTKELKATPPSLIRRFGGVVSTDIPLLAILLAYTGIVWFGYVHRTFLIPQYNALKFTSERSILDNTYYNRVCDADDMTTRRGADLFLPLNATPEEAYQHQLKHGFSVFRSILDPETANDLREYVVAKNRNLRADETIYVIENDNRYSFGLGTEIPSVAKAMKQLAQNMGPSLEKILGPDPALIEMTAITSSYGAVPQWWHDDVIPSGSPVQFGRAFGPSYSVFIQLQNTTKEMGATSACPGTHFCASGTMERFCDEEGFQLTSDSGFWHQGDALLMNMNSWHRGAAHTGKDALDRVMLILTFVPKPMERAEVRQMSQGITFSLRWDMWVSSTNPVVFFWKHLTLQQQKGHTLRDLADADIFMTQPYATLRALGLYKQNDAVWGIDYITSASMRAANDDNGFTEDELESLLNRGGVWFLPKWLQHFEIDWEAGDPWPQYITGTQKLCETFLLNASRVGVALYFFGHVGSSIRKEQGIIRPCLHLLMLMSIAYGLYQWAKSHVDETGWAKDIRAGRRYATTTNYDRSAFHTNDAFMGPSTYPTKHDVLIESRYGSKELAMYNDYIPLGHPGNRLYRALVNKKSHPAISRYGKNLQEALAHSIQREIHEHNGRFLVQGPDGFWMWPENSLPIIRKELLLESMPAVVKALDQTARFIESDYKYKVFRDSALSFHHTLPHISVIRSRLIEKIVKTPNVVQEGKPKTVKLVAQTALGLGTITLSASKPIPSSQVNLHEPPYKGAWVSEGDLVEAYDDDYWYFGQVDFVTSKGKYYVRYPNDSMETIDQYSIRPLEKEYHIGEELECWIPEEDRYVECTLKGFSDGTMRAVSTDGEELRDLNAGSLRREGPRIRQPYTFKGGYH